MNPISSQIPASSDPTNFLANWSLLTPGRESAEVAEASAQTMVSSRFGSIACLYVALRAKHPPAALHSLRVALWASAWGIKHGLREDQLQLFECVALLHEIGKIGVPDRVLQKPERLIEVEQNLMDMHTQVGLEILRASGAGRELLISIAGIGTSYENSSSIHSHDIAPMASRLVNIIDAFDSMTAKQCYRDSLSSESALAEIIRLSGKQFDPNLARSFTELVLSHDRGIQNEVAKRWINQLESHDLERLFQSGVTEDSSRIGSSIVYSLNNAFYRRMLNHIQNGIIFIDSEFRILDWNTAAEKITGRSSQSVLHQRWTSEIANLCDVEGFRIDENLCPFRLLLEKNSPSKQRFSIRNSETKYTQVSVEVVPITNGRDQICGAAMILEDVSETAELEQKIVHLRERACQDQLTKVANRGELNRQLPEFVAHHQRTREPGSIIICDIDYFKKINDNFSHQAGDEALILFAKLLKESSRETDFIARYGGEEFVILCGQCDLKEAKDFSENLRRKLRRLPIPSIRNQHITASFGVAMINPEDTEETVLGRADKGLLIAKESGRDRVVCLGEAKPSRPSVSVAPSKGWFRWIGTSTEHSVRAELITNAPREVTLQKLKGFVQEYRAVVHHVDQSNVVLEIDSRLAPIPKMKNERLGKFRLSIEVADVEMKAGGNQASTKICTLLDTEITALKNRDRRGDSIRSQANRIKTALQVYLVAHEMDDSIRQDILRKIKPETDSCY
ncbi:MAG: diguanylate cyclase [Pirellula sp.]|jgi:diguanylate cyclase (GGDEF)-like protein/PAS domain S-box-containing protein